MGNLHLACIYIVPVSLFLVCPELCLYSVPNIYIWIKEDHSHASTWSDGFVKPSGEDKQTSSGYTG